MIKLNNINLKIYFKRYIKLMFKIYFNLLVLNSLIDFFL